MAADPGPSGPMKFSRVQVIEAAGGAILAAAIMATASGVVWLVVSLPNRLQAMEGNMRQILGNQTRMENQIDMLGSEVRMQDRRIIKLELR